jgi:release factor glutamine methyltransferase
LLEPLTESVELVAANLPYIPTAELANLEPDVRCFEPISALDGGADGLAAYRELLDQVPAKLSANGHLIVEIEFDQGPAIMMLVKHYLPNAKTQILKDYADHDRIVLVGS